MANDYNPRVGDTCTITVMVVEFPTPSGVVRVAVPNSEWSNFYVEAEHLTFVSRTLRTFKVGDRAVCASQVWMYVGQDSFIELKTLELCERNGLTIDSKPEEWLVQEA